MNLNSKAIASEGADALGGAFKAKAVFEQNATCMIAMFLLRHPDIDPADVELVFAPQEGGMIRFSIEPKELHVPPEDTYMADIGADHGDIMIAERQARQEGWNACRDAMIAKAKAARSPEALVSTLDSVV